VKGDVVIALVLIAALLMPTTWTSAMVGEKSKVWGTPYIVNGLKQYAASNRHFDSYFPVTVNGIYYPGFKARVSSIPSGSWVLYDIEKWPWTPLIEQQHPLRYMKRFTDLAHSYGLKVILAPGPNLCGAWAGCVRSPGSYASTLIKGAYQAGGNIINLMLLSWQCKPSAYAYGAKVARAYVPRWKLVAEQWTQGPPPSRSHSGMCSWSTLQTSWKAAEPYVSGRWVGWWG
jgi:hypothetical protein